MSKVKTLGVRHEPAPQLDTPTDLSVDAVREVSRALNGLLADAFALYVKTKNFHWHVSGPHFRDYHLLLDEQAEQILLEAPRCVPSAISPGIKRSRTMTRRSSLPTTCCAS